MSNRHFISLITRLAKHLAEAQSSSTDVTSIMCIHAHSCSNSSCAICPRFPKELIWLHFQCLIPWDVSYFAKPPTWCFVAWLHGLQGRLTILHIAFFFVSHLAVEFSGAISPVLPIYIFKCLQ